ncbi:MAG: FTR1 family iron permease [Deltaproteobacteria bacterium]|nr:FTR1 family iron permease [Deltaproteobacteria bacterium]
MNIKFTALILFFLLAPSFSLADTIEKKDWNGVANQIEAKLYEAKTVYEQGDHRSAKRKVSDAYFDLFEGLGMESAVSLYISEERTYQLESLFGSLRRGIDRGLHSSQIKDMIVEGMRQIYESAAYLNEKTGKDTPNYSPLSSFVDSFIIIVREGFEAILIISALIAYLVRSGHKEKVNRIYLGAVSALVASVITAIVLNSAFSLSGEAREGMEGITMLIATALLFYVSYWLISKAESTRWQSFIKDKVEDSLSKNSLFALGATAFLAVYREGAETIIFYQALLSGAGEEGKANVYYGFIAGSIVLVLIYYIFKYTTVRIPMGPFFAVTSALLYYLAFSFAGKGVLELQEAGWISDRAVNFPTIHLLGIYPSLEGLTLQGILLMAAIIAGLTKFFLSQKEKRMLAGNG